MTQSLLWQTGALTYVAPLVLFSFFVAVISRAVSARHGRLFYTVSLACAGILPFVAGGFSDAYVVLQSCGLILSLLGPEVFARNDFKSRLRPFLLVGLFGSLLALIVVAVAPGNSIRQTYFPKQFTGWNVLAVTVRYSIGFVAQLVLSNPIIFITSLLLPFVTAVRDVSLNKDRPGMGDYVFGYS